MSANEPAFPFFESADHDSQVFVGLTKRELFAAMALQGMMAIDPTTYRISNPEGRMIFDWYSADAVSFANALIAELNKVPNP